LGWGERGGEGGRGSHKKRRGGYGDKQGPHRRIFSAKAEEKKVQKFRKAEMKEEVGGREKKTQTHTRGYGATNGQVLGVGDKST